MQNKQHTENHLSRSLYIHFPFCEVKCHYCDFYSLGRSRTREGDHDLFEKALKTELSHASAYLSTELDTIFLGGGTPSMTACDSLRSALEPLWEKTKLAPDAEWTMEANPSSVTFETLKTHREIGINRLSFGVQAMRDDLLARLGRVHSREAVLKALDAAFEAGFKNISVDLLCGVPGQTLEDLEQAIKTLTDYPITHLSCYLLTLPPHHKMYPELPNEEAQLSHLLFIHDQLTKLGFEHYEISNFAKPGKQARHNLAYWQGNSYYGVGPSAHSYDASQLKRWKNVSSLHKYSQLILNQESPIEWTETLTSEQVDMEKWMLALRLDRGFPEDWLKTPLQKERALIFEEKKFLERHPSKPSYWRLTPTGFALSDQVIRSFA